jgi:tetratricopeptide (TPR) repeat protein
MGEADLELLLGRHARAVLVLAPAIESSENPFERAAMLVAMAEARLALGDVDEAVASARRAIEASRHESVLYLAARVLLHAGDIDGVEEIAARLEDKLQSQTSALAGLLRGELAFVEDRMPEAVRTLRDAWKGYDFWFAHYLLGRAYLEVGHLPEALDELDLCVRRQGEITDVFLVDSATYRHYPSALYWLGRTHDAMGNREAAAELYRQVLDLRTGADVLDPLAEDAEARISML